MNFILLSLFVWPVPAAILFMDLNNAPKEVGACEAGAGPGEVITVNSANNEGRPVNAATVESAVAAAEARGQSIDSIVISGHDGSGEVFGGDDESNFFRASDLQKILDRHPTTKASANLSLLWGCYGGNVAANENFWLRASKDMHHTISFPIQSFTKDYRPSFEALGYLCKPEVRRQIRDAESKDQLCALYHNLPMLAKLGASACSRRAIASNLYNNDQHPGDCHSFDETHEWCESFDPEWKLLDTYKCYFDANDPKCASPPLDGSDVNAPPGRNVLREMYNQSHLYRHCADKLADDRGYVLPLPTTVIRLVKYEQVSQNINRLNRRELEDFDARLDALGLGAYKLGDLREDTDDGASKSRGWVKQRVEAATRALAAMASRSVVRGSTDARVVYTMARGLKATLVELRAKAVISDQPQCQGENAAPECTRECSHFSLVHADIVDQGRASRCLMTYAQAARL